LGTQSAILRDTYPESIFKDINAKYTEWPAESFKLAESNVYTDITENTLPTQKYIDENMEIVLKQVVKAGYRMANLLEDMWGNSNNYHGIIPDEILANDVPQTIA